VHVSIGLRSLDHVALWTDERDALAAFLIDNTAMHEIERTDQFTLVGSDARQGKLTLFDAEGPRERGVLDSVALRVPDLGAAIGRLQADGTEVTASPDGVVTLAAPGGLQLALVEMPFGLDSDLDHVVLRVPDPDSALDAFAELGFERRDGVVAVEDKVVRLLGGGATEGDRPLLNHIAVLVDSAREVQEEAARQGWDVAEVKDAANTLAVFVWGPDRIKVEYVEHKPGFALE
jgi:catechol 2,3-dioxygenase-like lactoylglutathione lyase family enzyme